MHTEQSKLVRLAEGVEHQHDVYPSRRTGPSDRRENDGRRHSDAAVVAFARRGGVKVGTEREGWRGRLAQAEMWLADAADEIGAGMQDRSRLRTDVNRALEEVRSMIDGDNIGPEPPREAA